MEKGDEVSIDIEPGKTLIVKFLTWRGAPGWQRVVYFELNGQPREVLVADKSLGETATKGGEADPRTRSTSRPRCRARSWASPSPGEEVNAGQKLLMLEAMKMETTLYAERAGKVAEVLVRPGAQVEGGDLVIRFE